MRGKRASGRPNSPFSPCGRRGLGGGGANGHQDSQTPPFPRVGEGGWGEEGQTDTGTPLPLSALSSPHAGQGDTLDEETL